MFVNPTPPNELIVIFRGFPLGRARGHRTPGYEKALGASSLIRILFFFTARLSRLIGGRFLRGLLKGLLITGLILFLVAMWMILHLFILTLFLVFLFLTVWILFSHTFSFGKSVALWIPTAMFNN